MTHFLPQDDHELIEIIGWAAASRQSLALCGNATKSALGRAETGHHDVQLSRLAGILDYEPAELVLTAQAGTPLDDIDRALAAHKQMLAFEPADWRALYGTTGRPQTLGGVISCNIAGPRRISAGAARDHVLGFAGVNGRGEPFKAGGKVVKNVTGYDLCKLVTGAQGTLAALTEITVKVMPRPETSRSLVLHGLDDAQATAIMAAALNSTHEVSGAAHLPAPLRDRAMTILRIEGHAPSVAHRIHALADHLAQQVTAEVSILETAGSETLWREIRDVGAFADDDAVLWRLSLPPATGTTVMAAISRVLPCRWFADWGGGLIWIAVSDPAADCGAAIIRQAVAQQGQGGHATLMRAPAPVRARVPVFDPLPPALQTITARVKDSFDPHRILNPGRLYADL